MCDYSIRVAKTRKAQVGDKLVTTNFNTGTIGFADVNDHDTAICVMPGTELAFESNIHRDNFYNPNANMGHATAIFRQVNKECAHTHHDQLELPNGETILLTHVRIGQHATVLQLPAEPKTAAEKAEQQRAEFVG